MVAPEVDDRSAEKVEDDRKEVPGRYGKNRDRTVRQDQRYRIDSDGASSQRFRSPEDYRWWSFGGLAVGGEFLEWRIAANPLSAAVRSTDLDVQKALEQAPYVVPDQLDGLSADYSGKTATVIAVQLHQSDTSRQRTNAMGDVISDDQMINPYFDLVVKFDDGIIAMTTQFPETIAVGSVVKLQM